MNEFEIKYKEYLKEFSKAREMVLATSCNNEVSARMMCIVEINGNYYFQTDNRFRKYQELLENPLATLCIDNIEIKGKVKLLGSPKDNPEFLNIFRKYYEGSYKAYSHLDNEVLFMLEPKVIRRWITKASSDYIEVIDLENKTYSFTKYR